MYVFVFIAVVLFFKPRAFVIHALDRFGSSLLTIKVQWKSANMKLGVEPERLSTR